MQDGFLGYKTSFMLDFVVTALIIIVPVLLYSLWMVKWKQQYETHRKLQITLGLVLLLAVTAFEVDLQIIHGGWENIVKKSQPTELALAERISEARPWLRLHLVFAITTPVIWLITLTLAWRKFSRPTQPGQHSRLHKKLGWLSTLDITATAITGLIFYYVAFVR